MSSNQYVLPVIEIFTGKTRRMLVQHVLDWMNSENREEWRTMRDIADDIDSSYASIRANVPPLVDYGVLNVRNPDASIPYFRPSESDVMIALKSWIDEGGYPLTDLFETSGRHDLVQFFIEQADPEQSYSQNQLHKTLDMYYGTVSDNIDVLVEAGVVEEVDGKRGTEYVVADSDTVEFLRVLNSLLVETYRERND